MEFQHAAYIRPREFFGEICPLFRKQFAVNGAVRRALLRATARGVYEVTLNGEKVGDGLFAPGFTAYAHRFQVQEYDLTALLREQNDLRILLAKGWYLGRVSYFDGASWDESDNPQKAADDAAILAELTIEYADGRVEQVSTDPSWEVAKSPLQFCDFYDGEIYDATVQPLFDQTAVVARNNDLTKICPQQGEAVTEHERFKPQAVITTPKGETVLDFGQNLTGYVEFTVTASAGDRVSFSFAEILDGDGNFYNANYRTAKCMATYICREGEQTHKPSLTFYGFRYLRVDAFPCEIDPAAFTAVAVYSDMPRTGWIQTADPLLNQLFSNVVWGQKSNYVDIPTDCPQRDERQGWTGDAQVFIKAAAYNFDVRRFFKKWLTDMKLSQREDGGIPVLLPSAAPVHSAAGWGDAVTICPWELYRLYGDREFLTEMFEPMKRWVDYITVTTTTPDLWTGGNQYGDWLELSAPYGEFKGETRDDFVATAFYARSTAILCRVGEILGEKMDDYRDLYARIVTAFRNAFPDRRTQTEYALSLCFGLSDDPAAEAAQLAERVVQDGEKIQTGFIGTPYILHALSENGYAPLAYRLLLRREYPSWLYPITKGATTIWEHWDGIMPDGRLWPEDMNSYNHYAYGAVADWLYSVAAGIRPTEAGFGDITFAPIPDPSLPFVAAELQTDFGRVRSAWAYVDGKLRYEITTPSPATAVLNGVTHRLETAGTYCFDEK